MGSPGAPSSAGFRYRSREGKGGSAGRGEGDTGGLPWFLSSSCAPAVLQLLPVPGWAVPSSPNAVSPKTRGCRAACLSQGAFSAAPAWAKPPKSPAQPRSPLPAPPNPPGAARGPGAPRSGDNTKTRGGQGHRSMEGSSRGFGDSVGLVLLEPGILRRGGWEPAPSSALPFPWRRGEREIRV